MNGPDVVTTPGELEGTPESREVARLLSELLAKRASFEAGSRRAHPRRRVVGEVEMRTALEALLAKLGADPRPPMFRALVACLAYSLAEILNLSWDSAYETGYKVGRCEPEPTLASAAKALGLPNDPWPTLEAFLEHYREITEPRREVVK